MRRKYSGHARQLVAKEKEKAVKYIFKDPTKIISGLPDENDGLIEGYVEIKKATEEI